MKFRFSWLVFVCSSQIVTAEFLRHSKSPDSKPRHLGSVISLINLFVFVHSFFSTFPFVLPHLSGRWEGGSLVEMEVPETTRRCGAPSPVGGVSPSHRSSGEDPRLRGPEAFKESQQDRPWGMGPRSSPSGPACPSVLTGDPRGRGGGWHGPGQLLASVAELTRPPPGPRGLCPPASTRCKVNTGLLPFGQQHRYVLVTISQ